MTANTERFNGADYQSPRDDARLTAQYARVFGLMQDRLWRSLREIAEVTGDPPASVSAQLRHMRKKRFGGHTVNRVHIGNGLYLYQLIANEETCV